MTKETFSLLFEVLHAAAKEALQNCDRGRSKNPKTIADAWKIRLDAICAAEQELEDLFSQTFKVE